MNDLERERKNGLELSYLAEGIQERAESGGKHYICLANLMGRFFVIMAKAIIDRLGEEEGGALLRETVERFAVARGKRIADKVQAAGRPLAFRNFLVFSDMNSEGVTSGMTPRIEDNDLWLEIRQCGFIDGARDVGLHDYAHHYCDYIDKAILRGYNPELKLEVVKNLSGDDNACLFHYTVKERESET
jgi:hypothetical protein